MHRKRKMKNIILAALFSSAVSALLFGCAGNPADTKAGAEQTSDDTTEKAGTDDAFSAKEDKGATELDIKKGVYKNAVCCHDPQIILADGTYYMTGSHQVLAKSDDMKSWSYIGNGNNVFDNIFSGDLDAFKYVGKNEEGGYSVWAANTFYNETMGKYVMYFCTTSTYIKSNLCMAVADEPGGRYTYTDTILYSGFTSTTAAETDIYDVLGEDADITPYLKLGGYDNSKWPNCIDPAIFIDEEGKMWMVYGSWSGGIFLLELDPATGKPIHPIEEAKSGAEDAPDPYFGYRLVGGGHHAIEGPYITYSPETGYYYLFVSYGGLTSNGGYQIRQFRSKTPTGPYVDAAGNRLGDEEDYMDYGLKMMGNYTLPSLSVTYMAPGGQSVFQDEKGDYYIVYHQRFDDGQEFHEPRIHKLFLTEDGWFTSSPFEYTGDESSPSICDKTVIAPELLEGTFYLIDHGIAVNDLVNKPSECTLENGTITALDSSEDINGTYELKDGTSYIHLVVNGTEFDGCAFTMTDEAGNNTVCISAKGSDNHTIWCVKFIK